MQLTRENTSRSLDHTLSEMSTGVKSSQLMNIHNLNWLKLQIFQLFVLTCSRCAVCSRSLFQRNDVKVHWALPNEGGLYHNTTIWQQQPLGIPPQTTQTIEHCWRDESPPDTGIKWHKIITNEGDQKRVIWLYNRSIGLEELDFIENE